MRNLSRLGGIATALTLVGTTVATDSAEGRIYQTADSIRGSVKTGVDSVLQPPFSGIHENAIADLSRLSYETGLKIGRYTATMDPNQLKLVNDSIRLAFEKRDLQTELEATRDQVAALVEQLETAHEEEVDGNGCPVTCTENETATKATSTTTDTDYIHPGNSFMP